MAVFNGTSAVTNNSTTVVFTGPTLSPLAVFPGAQVALGGYFAVIASITNTTTFELTSPYTGATAAAIPTTINTISESETEIVTLNQRTADLLEELLDFDPLDNLESISGLEGNGVIMQDATGQHSLVPKADLTNGVDVGARVETLAERAAYDLRPEGFSILVNDIGDGRAAIYFKMSNANADWSTPAYLSGPVGPTPTVTASATTLAPGSSATVTTTPIAGGANLNLGIPRGEGFVSRGAYSGATAYVKGDVVQSNSSSWIAKVATTGNAPPVLPTTSNTWWELLAAKGTDGTGTGDVVGPALSVNDRIAVFNLATGKIIKDGGFTIAQLRDASNLNAGTLPDARISQTLTPDKAFRRANIIGTVSQSGGVPTGAIIERGSNANGDYAKFADGTLICTHIQQALNLDLSNAYSSFYYTDHIWTFPHAFMSGTTPYTDAGYRASGRLITIALSDSTTPHTQATFFFMEPFSGSVSGIGRFIAIGKWF